MLSSISENSSSPEDKSKELAEAEQSGSVVAEEDAVIGETAGAEEEQTDTGAENEKEDLRDDLFPEAGQDMEVEESGGFKSPEALLNMAPVPETTVKQEVETD